MAAVLEADDDRCKWREDSVLSAQGLAVEFPIMRVEPKPVILQQPQSRVAIVGEPVQFTVRTANGTSQRKQRNGLALPQTETTLTIDSAQGSDASIYTFEVENSSGVLASEAAMLLMQPQMTLSTFAGQSRLGSDGGPIGSALFRDVRQMPCDSTGALYVIDGHAIRKIAGGMVTTLTGSSTQSGHVDVRAPVRASTSPSASPSMQRAMCTSRTLTTRPSAGSRRRASSARRQCR